jgi:hypothetical protein
MMCGPNQVPGSTAQLRERKEEAEQSSNKENSNKEKINKGQDIPARSDDAGYTVRLWQTKFSEFKIGRKDGR